jgi:glycosyltransferase involved in cell wall biosynthesis
MTIEGTHEETQPMMITVIIPVYNSPEFLKRCLEAVTASDYPHYQCIVVNDGSTDDSGMVARQFPVQVLELSKGPFGPAYARNRGAETARGEILFFVDADVVIYPDTLTKIAQTFARRPEIDAVFGSYDDSPGVRDFMSQYKNLFHHFVHQQGHEEAATFWAGCGAVRRKAFFEVGGFDEGRYPRPSIEDIELGYRLKAAGHQIALNKEVQAKHLKRWTLRGLIKSDVLDRGIPWTLLILQARNLPNDLNLRFSQRMSALLVYVILLCLGLSAFFHNIVILPLLVGLFFLVVGLWSEEATPNMSWRAEAFTYILVGAIAGLALYFDMALLLVPLAVVLFGLLARRWPPHPSALWRRVSFAAVVLGLTVGVGLLFISFPIWLVAPLLLFTLLIVLLNHRFYTFFARKRGMIFALAVVPFHLFYYFYSVLAFVVGTSLHLWNTRVKPISKPMRIEP